MKYQKIVILLLFLGLGVSNINIIVGAITSDWGDVVNIRFTLYLDASYSQTYNAANTDATLNYIYLSTGSSVPSSILEIFPEASTSYITKFEEGIIGLQVSETKNFKIDAADGYDSGDLAGRDLYFKVTLLEILYDASAQEETTSTTTTDVIGNSNFLEEFGAIIAIGGLVILIIGAYFLRSFQSSRAMKTALSEEKFTTSIREATIKKEKSQLKELRELTESYSESSKETPDKEEVKFRRRR